MAYFSSFINRNLKKTAKTLQNQIPFSSTAALTPSRDKSNTYPSSFSGFALGPTI